MRAKTQSHIKSHISIEKYVKREIINIYRIRITIKIQNQKLT